MKSKYIILALLALTTLAFGASDSAIYGETMIDNILGYDKEGSLHLGQYFTILQSTYFKPLFFGVLFGVPTIFLIHYLIIGPRVFSHDKKKIYIFTMFNRIVHSIAGTAFIFLLPTGLIMMFATTFGGGEFVRIAKEIHAISTLLFIISVVPMFLMWFKEMLFSYPDDAKWIMIIGGYLSKDGKRPIPAGKFNAGQKMWYWIATFGGFFMIATGAIMYFQDFKLDFLAGYITQIDLLRLSAIVHNTIGLATLAFFFVHVYLSAFFIKGAIHCMITGYKEEEEVEILHSSLYKKLKKEDKI